ncbi:hypothetical protein, partial [Oceanithermus sp.]|uniref:hypothetical protein n=1 Tax=Oceanithermus sp. TaxID=2268145 RepID=UPI00257D87F0
LAGLFTKAKPTVEHHDGYDPHRFVFFNASDKSVVYLGGHLFKWSGNRPLTHRALKGLEAHYGDPDEGWLGFLNPRLSRFDAEGGGIPEAHTVIVEPSGSITLIPNDKDALSDFLRASVQGKTQHIILILVLAYPATPGGIVTVGAPFRIKASAPDGVNHDGGIIGEMIAEQLVYSSSVKEKNIEP